MYNVVHSILLQTKCEGVNPREYDAQLPLWACLLTISVIISQAYDFAWHWQFAMIRWNH